MMLLGRLAGLDAFTCTQELSEFTHEFRSGLEVLCVDTAIHRLHHRGSRIAVPSYHGLDQPPPSKHRCQSQHAVVPRGLASSPNH